jgi:hypothetical protein
MRIEGAEDTMDCEEKRIKMRDVGKVKKEECNKMKA